jgi:parallel beta-helix repeat protein
MNCHRSIQGALDAADAGEEVAVYPGTYAENISVDTAGVQVVGKRGWPGKVLINPPAGVVVSLNAPRATLKNVTVQGGEIGILVTGDGAVIDDVMVFSSITGISVSSIGVHVMNSSVQQVEGMGIVAAGADFVVHSSVVQRVGGQCVDVSGDGALIEKNRIMDCGAGGVRILGSMASVTENDLLVAGGPLIHVNGPAVRISRNRLRAGRSSAMTVFSDSPTVANNFASDCETGIDVFCDSCAGGRLEGNAANGTYNCPGFSVGAKSAGFLVRNNTSRDSSDDGFYLSGVGMVVQGNKAIDNGYGGFAVYSSSDVRLVENKASANARNGIKIDSSASGTIVMRNRAHGNGEVDFYDAGTGTILGAGPNRNSFGTVGSP